MGFCQRCGGPTSERIPEGDGRVRTVCDHCGFIRYENPKLVVGALVGDHREVVLCRRNIEPRRGFWTIPAGFLELGEPAPDGARRETREETGLEVAITRPLVHFDIPEIGQIYLMFHASMPALRPEAGGWDAAETLEVRAFGWDELPWDELAFDAVKFTLELFRDDLKQARPALHYGTIRRTPGAATPWMTQRLCDYWAVPLLGG
jgi:ADP-ribose/FAD diphosphatase